MTVEGRLDASHRKMGRAGYLVVTMLVLRRMRPAWVAEAERLLREAADDLHACLTERER